MERLAQQQRKSLTEAVSRYHKSLAGSPAEEFLVQRGLDKFEHLSKFRFGYVEDPLPEHEHHRGKLAIPYIRRHPRHGWTCVSIRFRTLDPDYKPKYASLSGDRPRIYNTEALNTFSSEIGICEGELDTVTANELGLPTVGVPGATAWLPHWKELFRGYSTVWVLCDGDKPGTQMGSRISKELPNAKAIHLPDGEDINSIFTSKGPEAVRALWGRKD